MTYFLREGESSPTSVPNAGKRLLETEAMFFNTSPLEFRLYNNGIGDLVSDSASPISRY